MIRKLCCVISLCCVFLLTACIGENYDFTPPAMAVWTHHINKYDSNELQQASVDWEGGNEEYKETIEDFKTIGMEQEPIKVNAGSEGDLELSHGDFKLEKIQVCLWQGNEKMELPVDDSSTFQFPNAAGEYILEVNLFSDSGKVQYVGNINLK